MSKYAHSQKGACSLRIFSDNILLRSMAIERAGWKLEDISAETGDSIGVFKQQIDELLENHKACLRKFSCVAHEIAMVSSEISQNIKLIDSERERIITDYFGVNEQLDSSIDNKRFCVDSLCASDLLNIYFVVEASGRVSDATVNAVWNSIEELMPELNDISEAVNVDIRVQTLIYNIGAKWLDPTPVPCREYPKHQVNAFGLNNFGEACVKVASVCCEENFLQNNHSSVLQPLIIYVIVSDPTGDYTYGVDQLQKNLFYQTCCKKYVCYMGNSPNRDLYAAMLGENITELKCFTPYELKNCITLKKHLNRQ